MKIGITGCRRFNNYGIIESVLNEYQISEIITGSNRPDTKTDFNACRYAKSKGIKLAVYLPEHQKNKQTAYHPKYFHIRNKQIAENCDLLIAFWDGKSRGTLSTINYAKKALKEIRIVPITDFPMQ